MGDLSFYIDFKELLRISMEISSLSLSDVRSNRLDMLREFNGELFFALRVWPISYQRMFWKKPLSDKSTLQLFLFLCGNGCPPQLIAKWILYSQFWNTKNMQKRFMQIKYIS